MSFNWDITNPADDAVISQFPTNERAFRTAARAAFNVDHDADGTGGHKQLTMPTQSDPAGTALLWTIWQNAGALSARYGVGAVMRVVTLPAATKALWPQAAPPTGWTLDTDVTDKVIRVNSTAGAGTGGSWTISGITVDSHILTIAEMPSHQHVHHDIYSNSTFGAGGGGSAVMNNQADHTNITDLVGGGGGHDHTLTIGSAWRPAYLDVCKGSLT